MEGSRIKKELITFDIPSLRPLRAAKSNPMRTTLIRRVLTNALMIAIIAPFIASCNKEEPTTAVITVKREDGTPVSDAYVRIFANPPLPLGDPTRLNKEGYTDGSGQVTFDYTDFYEQGQSGFAVLDLYSTKDTLVGEGIIKILEEEKNEETVFLKVPE